MKLLFDTSVWVSHLRGGLLADLVPAIRGRFTLRMDAVVAAELAAGCRSKAERRFVAAVCAPFARAGRLLVPSQAEYEEAGRALSRLRERGVSLAGAPLVDALIASVAAREGALLVTENGSDFEKLARVLPVRVSTLAVFRADWM